MLHRSDRENQGQGQVTVSGFQQRYCTPLESPVSKKIIISFQAYFLEIVYQKAISIMMINIQKNILMFFIQ